MATSEDGVLHRLALMSWVMPMQLVRLAKCHDQRQCYVGVRYILRVLSWCSMHS